jgi:hypothetical protein
MSTVFTEKFIQERIDAIQGQIVATEEAITKLMLGTVKSYSINTGQTTQSVTKKDVSKLHEIIKSLIVQLETWDMCLNGGGTGYVRSA